MRRLNLSAVFTIIGVVLTVVFIYMVGNGFQNGMDERKKISEEKEIQRLAELRQGYYNEKDANDFAYYEVSFNILTRNGHINKFEIINASNVLGEKLVKEANWSSTSALFIGNSKGSALESDKLINYYYGYAKNKNGGIYFFQIPADKIRIYQDATDGIYLVGAGTSLEENEWEEYDIFNLHIPPDTIIEKANLEILTDM